MCRRSGGRTKRSSGLYEGCTCPVNATEDVPIVTYSDREHTAPALIEGSVIVMQMESDWY